MKTVYLLYACNAWHEHSSRSFIAAFDSKSLIEEYVTNFLSTDEVEEIIKYYQTQGKETNYIIDVENLNPIFE